MTLALLGGSPVLSGHLDWHAFWPPVNAEAKLTELYRSRRWTAFDESEPLFAQAFAQHHGAAHGIFMMNGTVTLQCALSAYGIGPGDEVVVPALTWCSTAMAPHYIGAKPVFVDIDPETLCIDPEKIEAAITTRTKAIIPVHLHGSMADMDRILGLASKHQLRVIEDCAQMHGGIWHGKRVGSLGDVGSFSFQHSKLMAAAEGGMCITADAEVADRLYRLKQIGYGQGERPGKVGKGPPPGMLCYNFRATAFQAVLLHEQLKDLDAQLRRYEVAVKYLEERLGESTEIRFQKRGRCADLQAYYAWVMVFDAPIYADVPIEVILQALLAEGLPATPIHAPVYEFMLFNLDISQYRIEQPCSVSERISARALRLLHPYLGLDRECLEQFATAIEKVAKNMDLLRRATPA